ncbi:MAG: 5-oxoprolinase subunit PxpB [Chloroflexota bacterium]
MGNRKNISCTSFGESGLLVVFGNGINLEINQRVHLLAEWVKKANLPGVIEVIPAYASVLIGFDPFQIEYDALHRLIMEYEEGQMEPFLYRSEKLIEIPTIYGGEHGPDLEFVAQYNHLSPDDVIRLHSEAEYRVFMMGFSPGFPYLGGMNPAIAVPRLSSPRTRVPAGSVGIAGEQTGIYPIDSAGGWRLIGWTPWRLFDPCAEPLFLLEPGDRLRFIPILRDQMEND